jgi:arginine decarboxylase
MPPPLIIRVSRGTGCGPTRLAAFDAALQVAGVADFNLLRLSSVIPPGSEVVEICGRRQPGGRHGDLLYCVYADAYASTPGDEAWAGVAWSTHIDETGAGLFVEHSGSSESSVRGDLAASLGAMSQKRANGYHPAGTVVSSAHCADHPVCAVVVAAFRICGWSDQTAVGAF